MDQLSPNLARAYRDWLALRHATTFPKRADFDPLQFGYVLGRLSLLQVHRNPLRFQYRIHGTESARWLGFDLTGKFFDEGRDPEWAELGSRHLAQVANTGLPSLERHFDQFVDHRVLNIEALVMPLSSDGVSVDYLISILVPHRSVAAGIEGGKPRTELVMLPEPA
jgi:hypothetical protein